MLSAAVFQAERSISASKDAAVGPRSLRRLNCADVRDDAFEMISKSKLHHRQFIALIDLREH